jgi:predicted small lipoprotein YifL
MRQRRIFGVLIGLFPLFPALAGCGSSGPSDLPVADLLVRTDKPAYSLAVDQAAQPILVNQGTVSIYAPMNEYVYIEQWTGQEWINRTSWFTVDGYGTSLPIAPGDSLAALPMDFGYVNNRAGIYRFVFEVALDPNGRNLVPEADRVSQPFEVTWE